MLSKNFFINFNHVFHCSTLILIEKTISSNYPTRQQRRSHRPWEWKPRQRKRCCRNDDDQRRKAGEQPGNHRCWWRQGKERRLRPRRQGHRRLPGCSSLCRGGSSSSSKERGDGSSANVGESASRLRDDSTPTPSARFVSGPSAHALLRAKAVRLLGPGLRRHRRRRWRLPDSHHHTTFLNRPLSSYRVRGPTLQLQKKKFLTSIADWPRAPFSWALFTWSVSTFKIVLLANYAFTTWLSENNWLALNR